jgi:3-deoxy-alpha-D-manno-octulosonate 8-oxidase
MKFRNFRMVSYVVYGRGSFDQLDEILAPQRKGEAPMIFLVDHYFQNGNGKSLTERIPLRGKDKIIFADVTYEPKTTQVDNLAKELKDEFGTISGIIGIGGGSVMDLAKAVSLMMLFCRLSGMGSRKTSRRLQSRHPHAQRNRRRSVKDYRSHRTNPQIGHEF